MIGVAALAPNGVYTQTVRAAGEVGDRPVRLASWTHAQVVGLLSAATRATFETAVAAQAEALQDHNARLRAQLRIEDLELSGSGKGGHVKVYEAVAKGEKVLVKKHNRKKLSRQEKKEWSTEKEALEMLDPHPFITPFRCHLRDEQNAYCVFDYIGSGTTLRNMMDSKPDHRIDSARVVFIAANIAVALDHLHTYGVIWRDCRPDNMLVDDDGFLKMCNFGLSAIVVDSATSFTICGNPEYLAPEVILGQGGSEPLDYWALGCVIFELIAGYTPFSNGGKEKAKKKVQERALSGAYQFPSAARFPQGHKAIVRGLLQAESRDRLGTRRGFEDVQAHDYFRGMDWKALEHRAVSLPPM